MTFFKDISFKIQLVIAFYLVTSVTHATHGYFPIGYGANSKGIAGANSALPRTAIDQATNPASIAFIEKSFTSGITLFSPKRSASIDCLHVPMCGAIHQSVSDREYFVFPHIAYTNHWNDEWSYGFATYANGGMHTNYNENIYESTAFEFVPDGAGSQLQGSGPLGVSLSQMLISTSVTHRSTAGGAFGVSLLGAIQRFKSNGLQLFTPLSNAPSSLTNRGYDYSYGAGLKIGYIHPLTENLNIAGTYTTKINMSRFDKYAGLFADSGNFDIPSHLTLGLAYTPTHDVTVSFDLQKIFYRQVSSISSNGPTPDEFRGNIRPERLLGAQMGIGFGWNNVLIGKVGATYRLNNHVVVLAGISHGEKAFSDNESLLNVLAPATIRTHASTGVEFDFSDFSVALSYVRSFAQQQSLDNSVLFGADVRLDMQQHALDFTFNWLF